MIVFVVWLFLGYASGILAVKARSAKSLARSLGAKLENVLDRKIAERIRAHYPCNLFFGMMASDKAFL